MAYKELTAAVFVEMLAAAADYLERNKEKVNVLNVFPVPDGDTGTNMTMTLQAARRELAGGVPASLGEAAQKASRGVLLGARGNSGVILSQFLRGIALGLAGLDAAGPKELAAALAKGTETAYRAVIKPVEGTMLTVGRGASDAARRAADKGADLAGVLEAAVQGAEEALVRTPGLLPVLAKAGVVDAGGQGLVYFLTGALMAVRGEHVPETPAEAVPAAAEAVAEPVHGAISHEDITFCYCTEFLIRGKDIPQDIVRARIGELGDSLLVVGDGDVVKVHVHTDHPGRALEIALEYGELLDIAIDNMQEQNRLAAEEAARRARAERAAAAEAPGAPQPARPKAPENGRASGAAVQVTAGGGPEAHRAVAVEAGPAPADLAREAAAGQKVRSAVVAVAPGPGWEELLRSLGVAGIVSGGQTMNPSAAELVEAIEAVGADEVIVMPNNSNIVFAARQAKELTEKRVHIVETTAAPQAVAAMMAFNPEGDPEAVAADMADAARQLRIAEITYAVRDSDAFESGIKAGDVLAIIDGDIRVVADRPEEAALEAVARMLGDDEAPLISVYFGADVDEADARRFAQRVQERWPGAEVEVYDGGQPVYCYILSVE